MVNMMYSTSYARIGIQIGSGNSYHEKGRVGWGGVERGAAGVKGVGDEG